MRRRDIIVGLAVATLLVSGCAYEQARRHYELGEYTAALSVLEDAAPAAPRNETDEWVYADVFTLRALIEDESRCRDLIQHGGRPYDAASTCEEARALNGGTYLPGDLELNLAKLVRAEVERGITYDRLDGARDAWHVYASLPAAGRERVRKLDDRIAELQRIQSANQRRRETELRAHDRAASQHQWRYERHVLENGAVELTASVETPEGSVSVSCGETGQIETTVKFAELRPKAGSAIHTRVDANPVDIDWTRLSTSRNTHLLHLFPDTALARSFIGKHTLTLDVETRTGRRSVVFPLGDAPSALKPVLAACGPTPPPSGRPRRTSNVRLHGIVGSVAG